METNITVRWEKGIPHHPKSIEIFKALEENDFKYGGDYFCFKSGGDGDNGEHLMYLLDIYFDKLDADRKCEHDTGFSWTIVKNGHAGSVQKKYYEKCPYCKDLLQEKAVEEICIKHGLDLESLEKKLREANQFCEIFKKSQIEFEKRIEDLETKLDVAIKSGEAWKKEALKENNK